ncbi:hypothetical protein pb186bvf_010080 [Paramecium bursaria]
MDQRTGRFREDRSLSYCDLLVHNPERKSQSYFRVLTDRYRSQSVIQTAKKKKKPQIKKQNQQKIQLRIFQVFKSDKPLTEFREFKFRTAQRNKENQMYNQ